MTSPDPTDSESRPAIRPRPTIAERAERREHISRRGSDRYSALARALMAGRQIPLRAERTPFSIHPVFWILARVGLLLVVAYVVGVFAFDWYREGLVQDWSGPGVVQSGRGLAGCPAAAGVRHETLPTWVRYEGAGVYVLNDAQWPVRNQARLNETGLIETGYSLGELRILLVEAPPPGEPPRRLIVVRSRATGGYYAREPTCA